MSNNEVARLKKELDQFITDETDAMDIASMLVTKFDLYIPDARIKVIRRMMFMDTEELMKAEQSRQRQNVKHPNMKELTDESRALFRKTKPRKEKPIQKKQRQEWNSQTKRMEYYYE